MTERVRDGIGVKLSVELFLLCRRLEVLVLRIWGRLRLLLSRVEMLWLLLDSSLDFGC